jgi:hypothetical protein
LSGQLFTDPFHPAGCSLFLRVLHPLGGSLQFTVIVQPALGLATAAGVYVVCRLAGARRGVAVVPAAVVALSGDQLYFEHMLLSDGLFLTGLVLACYLILRRPPRWDRVQLGAALVTVASLGLVRGVGVPSAPVLLLWLFTTSGPRWRYRLVRNRYRRGCVPRAAAALRGCAETREWRVRTIPVQRMAALRSRGTVCRQPRFHAVRRNRSSVRNDAGEHPQRAVLLQLGRTLPGPPRLSLPARLRWRDQTVRYRRHRVSAARVYRRCCAGSRALCLPASRHKTPLGLGLVVACADPRYVPSGRAVSNAQSAHHKSLKVHAARAYPGAVPGPGSQADYALPLGLATHVRDSCLAGRARVRAKGMQATGLVVDGRVLADAVLELRRVQRVPGALRGSGCRPSARSRDAHRGDPRGANNSRPIQASPSTGPASDIEGTRVIGEATLERV